MLVVVLVVVGLALPVLLASGEAANQGLTGVIRRHAMEASGGGAGFRDGEVVFEAFEPDRITVEQLPTLEGRLRGLHYDRDLLVDELIWYGVSLRECIAHCLELPVGLVSGDASLDGLWFDVNAACARSLFDAKRSDWSAVQARVLDGLASAYGLRVATERAERDVVVLRAGPGWSEHERSGRRGRRRTTRGPGLLELEGAGTSRLLELISESLGYDFVEGLDPAARCDVVLSWEPGSGQALASALAEQLDLHLVQERREVDVALVEGVPTPALTDG